MGLYLHGYFFLDSDRKSFLLDHTFFKNFYRYMVYIYFLMVGVSSCMLSGTLCFSPFPFSWVILCLMSFPGLLRGGQF